MTPEETCASSSNTAISVRGVSGIDERTDEGDDEWIVASDGRDDRVELSQRACKSARPSGLGEREKVLGEGDDVPSRPNPRPRPVLPVAEASPGCFALLPLGGPVEGRIGELVRRADFVLCASFDAVCADGIDVATRASFGTVLLPFAAVLRMSRWKDSEGTPAGFPAR